ncbi:hypothetical protein ES705_36806 [subsurface metagenome]
MFLYPSSQRPKVPQVVEPIPVQPLKGNLTGKGQHRTGRFRALRRFRFRRRGEFRTVLEQYRAELLEGIMGDTIGVAAGDVQDPCNLPAFRVHGTVEPQDPADVFGQYVRSERLQDLHQGELGLIPFRQIRWPDRFIQKPFGLQAAAGEQDQ